MKPLGWSPGRAGPAVAFVVALVGLTGGLTWARTGEARPGGPRVSNGPGHSVRALAPAGIHHETVRVDTLMRRFAVHVPPGRDTAAAPAPVVLVFHGGSGGSGARIRGFIGDRLEAHADRRGFLVVYADGIGGGWNDCRAGAPYEANREDVDDPAFVHAIIRRLATRYGADPGRVYALGYSNGAQMAYRLVLESQGTLAAIAAIGANLPAEDGLDCTERPAPVPALVVNGTADPINPYDGGEATLPDGTPLGRVRSARETVAYFARLARHPEGPRVRQALPPDPEAGTSVEIAGWHAPGRPDVELVTIHGGGHTLPGPTPGMPPFLGPREARWDAVAEAIGFFFRQASTAAGP